MFLIFGRVLNVAPAPDVAGLAVPTDIGKPLFLLPRAVSFQLGLRPVAIASAITFSVSL